MLLRVANCSKEVLPYLLPSAGRPTQLKKAQECASPGHLASCGTIDFHWFAQCSGQLKDHSAVSGAPPSMLCFCLSMHVHQSLEPMTLLDSQHRKCSHPVGQSWQVPQPFTCPFVQAASSRDTTPVVDLAALEAVQQYWDTAVREIRLQLGGKSTYHGLLCC